MMLMRTAVWGFSEYNKKKTGRPAFFCKRAEEK